MQGGRCPRLIICGEFSRFPLRLYQTSVRRSPLRERKGWLASETGKAGGVGSKFRLKYLLRFYYKSFMICRVRKNPCPTCYMGFAVTAATNTRCIVLLTRPPLSLRDISPAPRGNLPQDALVKNYLLRFSESRRCRVSLSDRCANPFHG